MVGSCSRGKGGRNAKSGPPDFFLRRKVLIIFLLASISLIGAWTMDTGVSGIGAGNANVILTNGFWAINPTQGYHLGLFMMLGSLFGLALVSLRMAVDGR